MDVERALRESLAANDLTLWSASGACVVNGEEALRDLAQSLAVRLGQSFEEERVAANAPQGDKEALWRVAGSPSRVARIIELPPISEDGHCSGCGVIVSVEGRCACRPDRDPDLRAALSAPTTEAE